jgi:hypothetical protein
MTGLSPVHGNTLSESAQRQTRIRAAMATAGERISVRLEELWPDVVERLRHAFPGEWERIAEAENGLDGAALAHIAGAAPWSTVNLALLTYEGAWMQAAERLRRWEQRMCVRTCDQCGANRPLILIRFDDGGILCGRCWRG